MLLTLSISTIIGAGSVAVLGNAFAFGTNPWYNSRQFVPTFGMVIGNVMTSTAIAISTYLSSIVDRKERIEMFLAFGASRWEASKPIAIEAIRLGILPGINSMAIIGLISIPGMMTGQILSGSSVDNAVKYQEIIMFMICSSSCISVILTVMMATFVVFDEHNRLRLDRIQKQTKMTFSWPSFYKLT
jgi:uncharacterized protein (TIGR00245 family)